MKKYYPIFIIILLFSTYMLPTINGLNQKGNIYLQSEFESFENGFGRWESNAHMPGTMQWYIARTQETAHDGEWSLNYTADGSFDWGAVWMQREINLTDGAWDIGLDFYVSGGANTPINAWIVIAYIGFSPPEVLIDFTSIGIIENESWSLFDYQETIVVNEPTTIWVAFGFRIIWETWRTYYFDSVTISGIPNQDIQCGDANDDDNVDISDAVFIINYLFIPSSPEPNSFCRADANGDGIVNVSDAVYLINYVFIPGFPVPVDDCC